MEVHRSAVSCGSFAIIELINEENYHPEVLNLGRRELNKLQGHITKRKAELNLHGGCWNVLLSGIGGKVSTLQKHHLTHSNKSCIPDTGRQTGNRSYPDFAESFYLGTPNTQFYGPPISSNETVETGWANFKANAGILRFILIFNRLPL